MKNKYVCIHGHFYQPPRENPWTEEVETEESAAPDHDWNRRIFRECYAANLESPIQDSNGKVLKVVNNYEFLSFNFGPTLFSWMERQYPDAYARIVAADATSLKLNAGHGNAIAQGYNHIILPLASRRDKLTQIRWGIEDFQSRFNREPEGMWLPETAVDEETLECLIAEEIRFVILAPSQAARIRPLGDAKAPWTEATGGSLNVMRPYRWVSRENPQEGIDIVFFHSGLSHAVAFDRILNDGENFLRRMVESFHHNDEPEVLLVANDGESYGHHHRFGNMALSYAFNRLLEGVPGVSVANLSQICELLPPTHEVGIRPKTAWSCAHGVGRWKEDCGCNMGNHPSWNQKWRKPLRESFDWLASTLDSFYEDRASKFFQDPWYVRDMYIHRFMDRSDETAERFLSHARKKLSPSDAREALMLCELQRYRMYMFTSCGWFFDDISGIESTQIMKYAARAIDLTVSLGLPAGFELESDLLNRLKDAKSNLPEFGNGADVYRTMVLPLRVTLRRAAAHFAILDHWGRSPALPYDIFTLERSHQWQAAGSSTPAMGRASGEHLTLRHERTLENLEAIVAVWDRGATDVECRVRRAPPSEAPSMLRRLADTFAAGKPDEMRRFLEREFDPELFTLEALFADDRRQATQIPKQPQKVLAH